jgi:glycine hydroxymethyltransferase
MTTRGFCEPEAEQLGHLVADVLERPSDEASITRAGTAVKALCARFPVYGQ